MTPRAIRAAAAGGLLVASVAFLATLLPWEAQPKLPARAALRPVPSTEIRTLAAMTSFAEFVDRPLFAPTRRPPPPQPEPQSAAAAPPPAPPPPALPPEFPNVTLLAVALAPNSRQAVIRLPTGHPSTLREGEAIEGWVLIQIEPDRVVFRNDRIERDLSFAVSQSRPSLAQQKRASSDKPFETPKPAAFPIAPTRHQ